MMTTPLTRPVVFSALDAFSVMGGLQRFNRRVTGALADLDAQRFKPVSVHLLGDLTRDLPASLGTTISLQAYKKSRARFITSVLRSCSSGATLHLIGHINLLPVAWACKRINPRLKTVLFVHGDDVWNEPHCRKRRAYEPWMLRSIDRIASVSGYTASIMAREFDVPADKFTLLPNAVDELPPPPTSPATSDTLLVVSRIGAGDRRKHVDAVIRAFARIAPRRPSARLEIVGRGMLLDELKSLATREGVADRTSFLGAVSDEELKSAYDRSTAFVLPSSKEGFGIVYIEAWQRGVPVICGARGASREIITEGVDGYAVDNDDIEGLASRMDELLADPVKARAMGLAGRDKVQKKYLDQHFRERLLRILLDLRSIERAASPADPRF